MHIFWGLQLPIIYFRVIQFKKNALNNVVVFIMLSWGGSHPGRMKSIRHMKRKHKLLINPYAILLTCYNVILYVEHFYQGGQQLGYYTLWKCWKQTSTIRGFAGHLTAYQQSGIQLKRRITVNARLRFSCHIYVVVEDQIACCRGSNVVVEDQIAWAVKGKRRPIMQHT